MVVRHTSHDANGPSQTQSHQVSECHGCQVRERGTVQLELGTSQYDGVDGIENDTNQTYRREKIKVSNLFRLCAVFTRVVTVVLSWWKRILVVRGDAAGRSHDAQKTE